MARSRSAFTTVRSEGGLLPADLLTRIVSSEADGLHPERDYHLPPNERLNEAISRSWNRLVGAWASFKDARARLPADAPATTETRERWLLVLFSELGFGRLQQARAIEIDGRSFPVSHGWNAVPVHLVGAGLSLDRRARGQAGAARSSPHGLLQELLNAAPEHLWGIVSNGLLLRLLRDNVAMTRQAYLEFDLEEMMDGQVYSDFVLLWLVVHESRFEGARPADCWLERWSKEAQQAGVRALDHLREGVERAIEALGRGFIAHRDNGRLRERLRSGDLDAQECYRQLLRVVYRLIFLFVAEDRDLLLPRDATPEAKDIYRQHYSAGRLRRLVERRRGATQHGDLWRALSLVIDALGSENGCPELGLPALGSFLWSSDATSALAGCELANRDLLSAVAALTFVTDGQVTRQVDYRNLGPEELGSVYESLLERHPRIDLAAGSFELETTSGNERKTTGSYYTPTSLIACLLDSALDPVLEEAARAPDPEAAILGLRVLDPACGSGHFLIAAAHRIARRLAAVKSGDGQPEPEVLRATLRDVISHCIVGVDVNSMAVELCKVNLWIEALEPGKPLSFLDHHIRRGNAVVGMTAAMTDKSIPDGAYEPHEGDDPAWCRSLRRRNAHERAGQQTLAFGEAPGHDAERHQRRFRELERISEDDIGDVRHKERLYHALATESEWTQERLVADAWCAAWYLPKRSNLPFVTTGSVMQLMTNADGMDEPTVEAIRATATAKGFFHWWLEFPDICGLDGTTGFDVVLGNPPWRNLTPDFRGFFGTYDDNLRQLPRADQVMVAENLLQYRPISDAWDAHRTEVETEVQFFKHSGRFRLFAPGNLGKGDINIFRMFVETALQLARKTGRVAQVVPAALYQGANLMAIRQFLFDKCTLELLVGCVNTREYWFKGIDSRTVFCLYVAKPSGTTDVFPAAFGVCDDTTLQLAREGELEVQIPVNVVRQQSPSALVIPDTPENESAQVTRKVYADGHLFKRFMTVVGGEFGREVDMTKYSGELSDVPSGLPLYEGRMIDAFDHRAKGYRSGRGRAAKWDPLRFGDPSKSMQPQWWVPGATIPEQVMDRCERYRLGFCRVTGATNERTLVAALIPPKVICAYTVPTITFHDAFQWMYMPWLAVANSLVMDFVVRSKVGTSVTFTTLDSLPFPVFDRDDAAVQLLVPEALRLTCTDEHMREYWNAMALDGWCEQVGGTEPLPGYHDEMTRLRARAHIDAIVARIVFKLSLEDLRYIFSRFPTLRRASTRKWGEPLPFIYAENSYVQLQMECGP
jgi:N-6 DNA Methylase